MRLKIRIISLQERLLPSHAIIPTLCISIVLKQEVGEFSEIAIEVGYMGY
jgi:hypothetical protein